MEWDRIVSSAFSELNESGHEGRMTLVLSSCCMTFEPCAGVQLMLAEVLDDQALALPVGLYALLGDRRRAVREVSDRGNGTVGVRGQQLEGVLELWRPPSRGRRSNRPSR